MRKLAFSLFILCFGINVSAQKNIDQKVNGLFKKMTIEEKAGQLSQLNSDWENLTGPILTIGEEDKKIEIKSLKI